MKRGYSIVAFTDHNKYAWHQNLTDRNFLAIAAFEANIDQYPKPGQERPYLPVYHFNFYDKYPQNRPCKDEIRMPERRYDDIQYLNEYIQKMNEKGFLVCYNHPYWSLQNYQDYINLKGLWAMEIYNNGCEILGHYGYNPQVYDEMLRAGKRIYSVAADDNHNVNGFESPYCDSLGGFVWIKADKLEYGAVMEALEKGSFYFSMGPEIKEVFVQGKMLKIKTSPVKKIYVIQKGRNCYYKIAPKGKEITEAEFNLTGKEGYIRIVVRDAEGLEAGTNAYWLDTFWKNEVME